MARTPSTMRALGTALPSFTLPDTDGNLFSIQDHLSEHGTLVLFICNHCPFVIHLREALAAFGNEMMERGLTVVAISSNDAENYPMDGPKEMRVERLNAGYLFPYLYDETQEVARAFDAACTPDFFLYDAQKKLVYRGQFDRSRPGNQVPVTGESLRAACESLLSTGLVADAIDQHPSLGCNIKWRD